MNLIELQHALRQLRCSGMAAGLEPRLLEAQTAKLAPIDFLSTLVQDELLRRQDRLLERRIAQAGFRDRGKTLDTFDFDFNKKMNRRLVFELATGRFVTQHEDGLFQGPPGTGKSYTGARMICALVAAGKNVGVTATSHKVIRNLLDAILAAAAKRGERLSCVQKAADAEDDQPGIIFAKSNDDVFAALGSSCQVGAGTAWLWARPEAAKSVDVLFVDEAAQMSLANVLAISQAAKSLVLLGDPRQLEQPTQGSHPDGAGVSALDHILGGRKTIDAERGLFLEETWRLHPAICSFTSELFYEGKLRSRPGLEHQQVVSKGPLRGSGLRYLPVAHDGNQNSSPEEADRVLTLVQTLVEGGGSWLDRNEQEHAIGLDDILIIAPYNAQVFELRRRLPQARIGTVDKFQGQEAPVVIYTMATSTPAEAPHGMEFLYSLNRLNVATSRARCLCVLVGTEKLFAPECRTPRQMQLANAFCRYREMAEVIGL